MKGYGEAFVIDETRNTVNSAASTETITHACGACGTTGTHVLIYAFAPPSDFSRWRCERCKVVDTVRGE